MCQVGEVPHIPDQLEAGRRTPARLRAAGIGVGELHCERAGKASDEEVMDLFGGELRQLDDESAEGPFDPLAGLRQHLVVGEEELGPARYDDFRPVGGHRATAALDVAVEGGEQGVEVRDRALVGNSGGEFVEAVEDEYEAALGEHVAEGVEVWPADLGVHQVLGDEPVELEGLLQLS